MNFDTLSPATFWIILGIVLALLEFAVPGFVIIFFGAGAFLTGLLCLFLHVGGTAQLLLFTISSLVFLFVFRRFAIGRGKIVGAKKEVDIDETVVGSRVLVVEDIDPQLGGKVELNGSNWTAKADAPIAKGTPAEVVARDGLTLTVRAL